MSSKSKSLSLTKEELRELLELLEAEKMQKKKKQRKSPKKGVQERVSGKRKRKQKQVGYVNELQKNLAKQYDINLPNPPPKSISRSYSSI
jgi:hypothetical protein